MEIIRFQYSEPQIIANTDNQTFAFLLQQKIYQINSKFSTNQQCLNRLVNFVANMQTSIKNLKIAKCLFAFFQSSILIFLKEFFEKSDAIFSEAFTNTDNENEKTKKNKDKYVILLSSINAMYKGLINGIGQIQCLSFLSKYGDSDMQKILTKTEAEWRYLKFLKKCSQIQVYMKDPNVRPSLKKNKLDLLRDEIHHIFKDTSCWYLEKKTFDKIILQFQTIIKDTKHAQISVQKNFSSARRFISAPNYSSDDQSDQEQSVRNILPCCRTYFYENETIFHAQSFTLQYKNYLSPYDSFCTKNLRKAICGFLNRQGGVILVGIMQKEDKSKSVKGQYLSQNEKEEVLKEYRSICGEISPDIIGQSKYRVKFVPIKTRHKKFIAGKYIVRVEISAGNDQSLYTYKENKDEYVALRTANEVLRRQINQETLLRFKQKLLEGGKIKPIHEMQCPSPLIGIPIWENNKRQNNNWNNNNKKSKINGRNNDKKDSDENSSQRNKNKKQTNWTEKMEQSAFAKKDKKGLDFVYFSEKPSKASISQSQVYKGNKFVCDDDQDDRSNRAKEEDLQEEFDAQAYMNNSLDFRPLNPVIKKRVNYVPKKPNLQRLPTNIILDEPNERASIESFTYKLDKVQQVKDINQKTLSSTQGFDILIVNYPYKQLVKDVKNFSISLLQAPIRCNNDLISWLKMQVPQDAQKATIQFRLFTNQITKKHDSLGIDRNMKIRKVFQNIIFEDEVLLNKLIHKYRHNEQFIDQSGVIYYKLKTNIEAIQAYLIAWDLNIKAKFISTKDLKDTKLEYLKKKAEKQF